MRILHFADAHIDIDTKGSRDTETGLPLRAMDFLKALDYIVQSAIEEKVDLVLFAGDAYKDRTPVPTYQRQWGMRIMQLSQAGIPTLLLVGNHDISPAAGRANTLQEFETLQVPHVRLVSKPCLLEPADLEGLPLQIIAIPWIYASGFTASQEIRNAETAVIHQSIENLLDQFIQNQIEKLDPALPTVLTAHGSISGAVYGAERSVMLGNDILLPASALKNRALSYVALGHIHKAQDVNHGQQPPIVYPGSIERVNFGEAKDDKFFVIADIEQGQDTRLDWRKIPVRTFHDLTVTLQPDQPVMEQIEKALPSREDIRGSMTRLTLQYAQAIEEHIVENQIRGWFDEAVEFYLNRKPERDIRIRLPENQTINSLTPLELLDLYWHSLALDTDERKILLDLARPILHPPDPESPVQL